MPQPARNKIVSSGEKSSSEIARLLAKSPTTALLLCLALSLSVAVLHLQQKLAQHNLEFQLLLQQQGLAGVSGSSMGPLEAAHKTTTMPGSSLQWRVPTSQVFHAKQQDGVQQVRRQGTTKESTSRDGDAKVSVHKKRVPDIFVGVFTTFDTAAALAAEAWAVNEERLPAEERGQKDDLGRHGSTGTNSSGKADSSTIHPPSDSKLRYAYRLRRQALRMTWFPMGAGKLQALEKDHGIMMRFVVGSCGKCGNQTGRMEAALDDESRQYGDIMRLSNHAEAYHSLASKTRDFFVAVANMFLSSEGPSAFEPRQLGEEETKVINSAKAGKKINFELVSRMPRWVIKVDDDVYLHPQRLVAASLQWSRMGAEYVGCMKHGVVFTEPWARWHEPQHNLIGNTYYMHAYGSVYGISGRVVAEVIAQNHENLRLLANEDTSVGLWMISHQVTHFEDMRLCVPSCHPAAVAVLRSECAGLCDPVHDLISAHNSSACRKVWDWGSTGSAIAAQPGKGRVMHLGSTKTSAPVVAGASVPGVVTAAPHHLQNTQVTSSSSSTGSKTAVATDEAGKRASSTVGAQDTPSAGDGDEQGRTRSWDEIVQITPGEMPYLPSYPEHTYFEHMWV